ncbi:MAG TPA: YitT family protein, partial [Candidatus Marinimicrobia bacterium]|nr:YitT family protein [Candidatus Neomarinimicrobiota bacterium]
HFYISLIVIDMRIISKNGTVNLLYQTLLLTSGSILCALAVKALILPHGLLARGMTGFALIIYYIWPVIPLGLLYCLINIPVFLLGWRFVGRRFIKYSLLGMVIYSATLSLINFELNLSDPLLAVIIAGALSGAGTALILRSYGSSGGSDILCVILNKLFSITLGTGAILINAVVLILSAFIFPIEKVFYTLVFIFVSGLFTNKIFHGLANRRTAIIISDQWEIIVEKLNAHRIGVTLIKGQGGYHGAGCTLLYSVIPARSVSLLKRLVTEVDDQAFIAIMEADDVTGVEIGNQPHW